MREGAPKTIYRKDYQVPDYTITDVDLAFDIRPGSTIVRSELAINRTGEHQRDLVLDGVDLGIQSIAIDGRVLGASEYSYAAGKLSIPDVGDQFTFAATVEISPETNISYPVLAYPAKVSAHNFDKNPVVEGRLLGIKGQYLIFDTGVLNIRKFGGYHIAVEIEQA